MPSPLVIEKLDQLKKELENLKNAAQLIEQATSSAVSAGQILTSFPDFLLQQNTNNENLLNDLKKHHKVIVGGLEEQLQKLIQVDVPDKITIIRNDQQEGFKLLLSDFDQKYTEAANLLKKLTSEDLPLVINDFVSKTKNIVENDFPGIIQSLESKLTNYTAQAYIVFEEKFNSLSESLSNLLNTEFPDFISFIRSHDKQAREELIQEFQTKISVIEATFQKTNQFLEIKTNQLSEIITQIDDITHSIKSYLDEIKQIDLPKRLDKIDATTAGLMSAVQSTQSRIDISERNLGDLIKSSIDLHKSLESKTNTHLESIHDKLEERLKLLMKKHRQQSIISWLLASATIALVAYTLL
jgi:hypothetical protein